MIHLYWCEYAEGGPCWVLRYGDAEMDFVTGHSRRECIRRWLFGGLRSEKPLPFQLYNEAKGEGKAYLKLMIKWGYVREKK